MSKMRSIIQIPDGRCYLCELLGDYSEKCTEEHHAIGGTANRKISERTGLKVYLCPEHHRIGKNAVHNNHVIAAFIQDKAQSAYESYYQTDDFVLKFGKNYHIDEKERLHAIRILRGEEL